MERTSGFRARNARFKPCEKRFMDREFCGKGNDATALALGAPEGKSGTLKTPRVQIPPHSLPLIDNLHFNLFQRIFLTHLKLILSNALCAPL